MTVMTNTNGEDVSKTNIPEHVVTPTAMDLFGLSQAVTDLDYALEVLATFKDNFWVLSRLSTLPGILAHNEEEGIELTSPLSKYVINNGNNLSGFFYPALAATAACLVSTIDASMSEGDSQGGSLYVAVAQKLEEFCEAALVLAKRNRPQWVTEPQLERVAKPIIDSTANCILTFIELLELSKTENILQIMDEAYDVSEIVPDQASEAGLKNIDVETINSYLKDPDITFEIIITALYSLEQDHNKAAARLRYIATMFTFLHLMFPEEAYKSFFGIDIIRGVFNVECSNCRRFGCPARDLQRGFYTAFFACGTDVRGENATN